ncbi:MAG: hypothetical protein QMB61_02735, partial [Clostridiaceae bacterium]
EEGRVWKRAECGRGQSVEEGRVWKRADFRRRQSMEEGSGWRESRGCIRNLMREENVEFIQKKIGDGTGS